MNEEHGTAPAAPVDIGDRLELFVDQHLVERFDGVSLRLHAPVKQPRSQAPLAPPTLRYMTVIQDGDIYRAYYNHRRDCRPDYRGEPIKDNNRPLCACYEESHDGIEWHRPSLGLVTDDIFADVGNAVLGESPFGHNLSPFLDRRPDVPHAERFKALAGVCSSGLYAFASGDGIHWAKMHDQPVIRHDTTLHGQFAFDSMNVAFWSEAAQRYVCYFRHWKGPRGLPRSIGRAVSPDFANWTDESAHFETPNLEGEQLYTNQTHPYFRAPHIYIALPTRFIKGVIRGRPAEGPVGSTDIMLMTTRAGAKAFDRTFKEAFIRPGLEPKGWENRANYVALNVVPTGPAEMSIYHCDGHRYVLRTDGFASVHASAGGGESVTRPLIFSGSRLVLNVSTSVRGGIRIELQDAGGVPFPGLGLEDCDPVIGDSIEYIATWRGQSDIGQFAGRPVRVRFAMQDSDLYSLRFGRGVTHGESPET